MNEETTMTKKSVKKGSAMPPYRMYVIALVVLLLMLGGGYYGWMKYQEMYNSPAAQEQAAAAAADAEKKEVLEKLSKLMVLPEGDPVLFKVSDQEQMRKQQAFFKDTMNDDVLLVFQQSSKAIIYRPSTNLVVNVGPINFDQNQEAAKTTTNTTVTTPEETDTKTEIKK